MIKEAIEKEDTKSFPLYLTGTLLSYTMQFNIRAWVALAGHGSLFPPANLDSPNNMFDVK